MTHTQRSNKNAVVKRSLESTRKASSESLLHLLLIMGKDIDPVTWSRCADEAGMSWLMSLSDAHGA